MRIRYKRTTAVTATALLLGGGGAAALASTGGTTAPRSSGADTGAVQLTVTAPSGQTVTRPARAVSCKVKDGTYVLRGGAGHRAGARLTVASYTGPGSYTATLRLVARTLLGRMSKTVQVPVTLTSTGGTATVTRTLSGKRDAALKGKTMTVTANWTCTA